jgi:hypothetical protein
MVTVAPVHVHRTGEADLAGAREPERDRGGLIHLQIAFEAMAASSRTITRSRRCARGAQARERDRLAPADADPVRCESVATDDDVDAARARRGRRQLGSAPRATRRAGGERDDDHESHRGFRRRHDRTGGAQGYPLRPGRTSDILPGGAVAGAAARPSRARRWGPRYPDSYCALSACDRRRVPRDRDPRARRRRAPCRRRRPTRRRAPVRHPGPRPSCPPAWSACRLRCRGPCAPSR